jgi:hypothetical protein
MVAGGVGEQLEQLLSLQRLFFNETTPPLPGLFTPVVDFGSLEGD